MTAASDDTVRRAVDEVARSSYGRLIAYLAAGGRDLAAAEDALADAFVSALRTWPERGVPERPDSWLLTVARRTLIDGARRRDVATRALPALARLTAEPEPSVTPTDQPIPDTRLELLFACAHPAITAGMRSPLMLQTVLGLDAARIASAFLVSPTSMGQRLVRAKAKIKRAGIPFAIPRPAQLPERLEFVLDAIYAAYGTGWDDPAGHDPRRRGLTDEAVRLAGIVVNLLPAEPEAHGLLAALLHMQAREGARRATDGSFVPLDEQDIRRWSPGRMAAAERQLALALARDTPGPYQLHAAIQSIHNRRSITGRTDWAAIASLYDGLVRLTPSVGAHVARAAAHLRTDPAAALAMLDRLDAALVSSHQPYWVVRAHCLHRTDDRDGALRACSLALGLTEDPALREFLRATFAGWPGRPDTG